MDYSEKKQIVDHIIYSSCEQTRTWTSSEWSAIVLLRGHPHSPVKNKNKNFLSIHFNCRKIRKYSETNKQITSSMIPPHRIIPINTMVNIHGFFFYVSLDACT